MKLGEQNTRSGKVTNALLRVGLGLAIFAVGIAAGSQGWTGTVARQVEAIGERLANGPRADRIPAMTVDMAFEAYSVLLEQREQALDAGVYLSSQEGFVPAAVRLGDTAVEVQMQLKEGTAQNLGPNDKWAYELRVAGDMPPGELEFDRFFLQDPASNNWLSQWAFSEAMQSEGLMAARYRFVRLIFNGDDRGVYALQEGHGNSLTASQGHPPGVIVAFDTAPLWKAVAHFDGKPEAAFADPVSNLSLQDFRALGIETLGLTTSVDMGDPMAEKGRALSLLYALQTGQRSASEVFDAGQYGRFLALADLWGATHATSPLHLSYYYSAGDDHLEPVIVDAQALSSDDRLSLAATFADPHIQMAYAQKAARISQPAYLEQVERLLTAPWLRLNDALRRDLPDLEPPWDELAERQAMQRQSLNPGQPILAYERSSAEMDRGTLRIDIANAINLPVEILGFDLAGATFLDADQVQVASTSTEVLEGFGDGIVLRAAALAGPSTLRFTQFGLPLDRIHSVDSEADFSQGLDTRVAVRLLGMEDIHLVPVSLELITSTEIVKP